MYQQLNQSARDSLNSGSTRSLAASAGEILSSKSQMLKELAVVTAKRRWIIHVKTNASFFVMCVNRFVNGIN